MFAAWLNRITSYNVCYTKLLRDFFPVRQRIKQEAIVLVDRRYQLTIATSGEPIPVTGRNRQAPLGVQSYFGSPT